jgi:predicted nuclease of predicted toxin-antitoxin system
MKLLVDMNLSPRWIGLLQDAGWEAVHWSAVGKVSAPDSEVMAYAAQHDYVVLTLDLDFSAILAATHGNKPSVVQIRTEDVNPPCHRTTGHCGTASHGARVAGRCFAHNWQSSYTRPTAAIGIHGMKDVQAFTRARQCTTTPPVAAAFPPALALPFAKDHSFCELLTTKWMAQFHGSAPSLWGRLRRLHGVNRVPGPGCTVAAGLGGTSRTASRIAI